MKNRLFGIFTAMLAVAFTACPPGPVDGTLSGNVTISPNGTVNVNTELTAAYSGTETVTFQWYMNNVAVPGEITAKYTPTAAGNCTVTVNAPGYTSKTSAAVTVIVAPTLTGITAAYTGTAIIYPATPLDDLKAGLTVKAQYSDSSENNLSAGEYALSGTLTVGSSTVTVTYEGKTTTFDVTVTADNIANKVPTASAGGNKSVQLSSTASVTLDGSGADEDGTIASYAWTCTGKPNGAAAPTFSSTAQNPAVSGFDTVGDYEFQLKVTDNEGAVSAPATVKVTVTAPPHPDSNDIVISGATPNGNGEYKYSDTLTLGGNAAVAGHTYAWSCAPDTLTFDKTVPAPTVSGFAKGITYTFNLAITNEHGLTVNEPAVVKIAGNVAPTANITGGNQNVTLSNTLTVTLSGSGSDTDGTIASRAWTCKSYTKHADVATPYTPEQVTGLINSANADTATVALRKAGTYVFELKVTDNDGEIGTKEVTVVVGLGTATKEVKVTFPAFTPESTSFSLSPTYTPTDGWGYFSASDITSYTITDNKGHSSASGNFSSYIVSADLYPETGPVTFTQTFNFSGKNIGKSFSTYVINSGNGLQFVDIYDNDTDWNELQGIPNIDLTLTKDVSELP